MHTSLKELTNLLKQEGTSRPERYSAALHDTNTLMDDRTLQDMMAYMQRYSKNLLFINTEDSTIDFKKSWEYFFKNDILFLIADVATKKVGEIREVYEFLSSKFEQDKSIENFIELIEYVFSRLQKIDGWYKQSEPDKSLRLDFILYIRSYLQKELDIVREMLLYCYGLTDNRRKIDDFRNELLNLDPIWEPEGHDNIALRERIFDGSDAEDKLTTASLLLNKTFDTLFHAIEAIVERCSAYFDQAVQERQQYYHDHNPHVALIFAFLKLFDYAKEEINKIPQRHLDFYYKDVLRIKEKQAVPDKTFVIFELAKGFDGADIKKGTKLSAGKDKQSKDLIYETDKDIVVNKARVQSLQTIFIDRNENHEILNYYKNTISASDAVPVTTSPVANELPGIFGDRKYKVVTEMGFAIASSQLYLAKGERTVTVVFESPVKIESCVAQEVLNEEMIFDTNIIKLLLTAEKGWIDSDNPDNQIHIQSLKKTGDTQIELIFNISIKLDQAITAFDKKLHTGNFNTAFPVMQCLLKYPLPTQNQEEQNSDVTRNQIDQLCILQKMQVKKVNINVQVGMNIMTTTAFDGVRDLVLENDESILDNKKPFYPFTAIPKVGSSFYIGCNDLFYKKITDLSFNLEWILPDNFDTYYQNYLPPYDAGSYTASLSHLEDKTWKKISDTAIIENNFHDQKLRSIRLQLIKAKQQAASAKPEDGVPTFDGVKKNGTFRLTLNHPDFGHGVYPQLITSKVMEMAAAKSEGTNYYQIIKHHLRDSQFSIKLESDIGTKNGSLKGVYQVLDSKIDNLTAKRMIIEALSGIISSYNTGNISFGTQGGSGAASDSGRMMVNDDNFAERILGFLRNIRIVGRDVHADRDKEGLQQATDEIRETVNKRAHFILPSDQELMNLITNETNAAINKTVANATDEIIALRSKGTVDPKLVEKLLVKEFDEVNEVINDMIAKKIALHLSTIEIPPPPYSPLLKTISVSYSSEKELSADDDDKIFRVTPMGIIGTDLLNTSVAVIGSNEIASLKNNLFPRSLIDVSSREFQGMLFIGITELVPNENLSLLLQFAEGSRISDKKPPPVSWLYKRANDWVKLENDYIVSDDTYGLQTTGIIEFSIPKDAGKNSVLFNESSLSWLCAAVEQDAGSFPYIVDIKAQAVSVTFKDNGNDHNRLAMPLEAQRIKTAVDAIPQVKKISQPVPSFNGRPGESDKEFYIRVSERLRHKSRAVNNWDYERLVLEEFPSIFKVKCINNYLNGHFAIGHVTIVPIADLRNKNYAGSDLQMPKMNYIDLRNIENFLTARSSPFAKIHAVNPLLEFIFISCSVKFNAGVDKGFYLQQLNEDIKDFLTPWASGDMDAVSFSAKVYASSIINFIDKLDYVNYVVDLTMQQYLINEKGEKQYVKNPDMLKPLDETELTTGHSILVSAPKHEIKLVD